jgi:DNA mismatch repair protein MSH6
MHSAYLCSDEVLIISTGYKVGRVDQAETQLGAEMRQAATKGAKGKGAAAAAGDKIVRR